MRRIRASYNHLQFICILASFHPLRTSDAHELSDLDHWSICPMRSVWRFDKSCRANDHGARLLLELHLRSMGSVGALALDKQWTLSQPQPATVSSNNAPGLIVAGYLPSFSQIDWRRRGIIVISRHPVRSHFSLGVSSKKKGWPHCGASRGNTRHHLRACRLGRNRSMQVEPRQCPRIHIALWRNSRLALSSK